VQGAHREQDAIKFLEAVEQLDPMRVLHVAADFYQNVFHPLVGLLIRVLTQLAVPSMNMVAELMRSSKFMESLAADIEAAKKAEPM
jgi:hypothetical protein